jgi:hypothetical protein
MKKILAILFLLALAAFWSVQPRVKSHSSGSAPAAKVVIPHAATGVESVDPLPNLAIRTQIDCPPGYFDCDGCCVPYKCPDLPTGPKKPGT